MRYVIGIDPGLTGALAVLDRVYDGKVVVADMPVMAKGIGKKMQCNAAELAQLPGHYRPAQVWLEQVGAMPGQGVSSMFSFGESFGVIRGVVAALGVPLELVRPAAWKRRFGLLKADKDVARTRAIELYPLLPLSRKKDVGRADALLIARYGLEELRKRAAA